MIRKMMKNPSAVVGFTLLTVILLLVLVGPFLAQSPYKQNILQRRQVPSAQHLLGTDEFGRDVLSRVLTGGRYTLLSGICSVILGLIGGMLFGALGGFYGGVFDRALMTICDILLAFPSVLMAMAITMVLGPGVFTPMVAVGISSTPIFARLVRAQFMSLRDSSYIEAARSAGAGDPRLIFRHLLPNSIGPIITQATLRIGSSIILAATLSFLGLGAQPPTPEWGAMLNAARSSIWDAPHLAVIPGLAITFTVVAVNLIGDALRDYLDPRTRTLS